MLIEPIEDSLEIVEVAHLFRQTSVKNERSGEFGSLDDENYRYFSGLRHSFADPKDRIDERLLFDVRAFGDEYGDGFASLNNLLLQLTSIQESYALARKCDPDVYIFARPDLIYHDRIHAGVVRSLIRNEEYCALPLWQWWGGVNDRFAICGRSAASAYANRIERVREFCKELSRPLHAEALLKYALEAENVTITGLPMRASRVRIGGVVKQESFSAMSTTGGGRRQKIRLASTVVRSVMSFPVGWYAACSAGYFSDKWKNGSI